MTDIDLGDPIPGLQIEVLDTSGALADPVSITLTVTLPNLTVQTLSTVRAGVGLYSVASPFITTQAGEHRVLWTVVGNNCDDVFPDTVHVRDTSDASIVSLDDARSWLGIDRNDWDDLIRRALGKATEVAEDWTGKSYRRHTVTEVHDGGVPVIRLRSNPVQSITAVRERGTALQAGDYTFRVNGRLLHRGSTVTSLTTIWAHGVNSVEVDLVAGETVVPDKIYGAVEELTRHIFATLQDGAGQPAGDDEFAGTTPDVRRICAMLLGPRRSAI